MIVVDASAVAELLTDTSGLRRAVRLNLRDDLDWRAPDHITAEVFSAVRGQYLGRQIDAGQARRALSEFRAMGIRSLDTTTFLDRMWELRDNVSGYDAAYVAAAERYGCPLVTLDRRLASVPGVRCEIRVVAP